MNNIESATISTAFMRGSLSQTGCVVVTLSCTVSEKMARARIPRGLLNIASNLSPTDLATNGTTEPQQSGSQQRETSGLRRCRRTDEALRNAIGIPVGRRVVARIVIGKVDDELIEEVRTLASDTDRCLIDQILDGTGIRIPVRIR